MVPEIHVSDINETYPHTALLEKAEFVPYGVFELVAIVLDDEISCPENGHLSTFVALSA